MGLAGKWKLFLLISQENLANKQAGEGLWVEAQLRCFGTLQGGLARRNGDL